MLFPLFDLPGNSVFLIYFGIYFVHVSSLCSSGNFHRRLPEFGRVDKVIQSSAGEPLISEEFAPPFDGQIAGERTPSFVGPDQLVEYQFTPGLGEWNILEFVGHNNVAFAQVLSVGVGTRRLVFELPMFRNTSNIYRICKNVCPATLRLLELVACSGSTRMPILEIRSK